MSHSTGGCNEESHDHDHDHDHIPESAGFRDNLFQRIDRDNVVALNAEDARSGPLVIKPWNERLDERTFVESDADDQLILRIPFTGAVKLRALLLKAGPADQTPSKVALFANQDNLDFSEIGDRKPAQEFTVPQGRDVGEYHIMPAKFPNLTSITLFFPASQGAETVRIYYVGFLGQWSERKFEPVMTVYESKPNLADHDKIQGLNTNWSAPSSSLQLTSEKLVNHYHRKKNKRRHTKTATPLSPAQDESYAALEQQVQTIECQIDVLRHQLAQLRSRQNALVPANRNPDEVLLAIFSFLVQPAAHDASVWKTRRLDIISVSHVCARWRTVAIGSPALWAEVPVYNTEQALAFIERSREMARLRSLSVSATHWSSDSGLDSGTDTEWWLQSISDLPDASALEELSLIFENDERDHVSCKDKILGGRHPALRSLTIQAVCVPHASPLYTNLRHLSMSCQPEGILTGAALLEVLAGCPNLETFSLDSIIRDYSIATANRHGTPPSRPVALPLLSKLHLEYVTYSFCNFVLPHLVLPQTVRFHLNHKFRLYPDTSSAPLALPRSSASFPSLAGLRYADVVIAVKHPSARWECQPFTLRANHRSDLSSPALLLEMENESSASCPWLRGLPSLFDTSAVDSYTVRFDRNLRDHPFTPQTWRTILGGLGALTSLCSSVDGSRFGTSAAHYAALLAALSEEGEPACPALETLQIEGAHCDKRFWQAMERMVAGRRLAAGGALRRVVLKDVVGTEDVVCRELRQQAHALLGDGRLEFHRVAS